MRLLHTSTSLHAFSLTAFVSGVETASMVLVRRFHDKRRNLPEKVEEVQAVITARKI